MKFIAFKCCGINVFCEKYSNDYVRTIQLPNADVTRMFFQRLVNGYVIEYHFDVKPGFIEKHEDIFIKIMDRVNREITSHTISVLKERNSHVKKN